MKHAVPSGALRQGSFTGVRRVRPLENGRKKAAGGEPLDRVRQRSPSEITPGGRRDRRG